MLPMQHLCRKFVTAQQLFTASLSTAPRTTRLKPSVTPRGRSFSFNEPNSHREILELPTSQGLKHLRAEYLHCSCLQSYSASHLLSPQLARGFLPTPHTKEKCKWRGLKASLPAGRALCGPYRRIASSPVRVQVSMAEGGDRAPDATRLGFIGAGQMAESLARGWDTAGVLKASQMSCTDVNASRLKEFETFGVRSCANIQEVAEHSDVLFIAVKPHVVKTVLKELSHAHALLERHLIVSIAAGITIDNMQSWAGESARVVRVMPNTPCLVGETAAAMSLGRNATVADADLVKSMFAAVGKIHTVDEKLLDAVTGLSGSGPAYIFVAIEALADGGVAAGLPRDVALSLAAQTVLGSAKMVLETGKHPGQLKDAVTSPGGTTIAGIHELEKSGFRASLMNAVLAAARRSKELSTS